MEGNPNMRTRHFEKLFAMIKICYYPDMPFTLDQLLKGIPYMSFFPPLLPFLPFLPLKILINCFDYHRYISPTHVSSVVCTYLIRLRAALPR